MITIELDEKHAKELLTFLLNYKGYLESVLAREQEGLSKYKHAKALELINPLINKIKIGLENAQKQQQQATQQQRAKKVIVVCERCGWKATLHGFDISEKDRILEFWRCPSNCGSKYCKVMPAD